MHAAAMMVARAPLGLVVAGTAREAGWLVTSPPKLSAATGWSRSGSSRTRGSTYAGHFSRRRTSRTTLRAPVGARWDGLCTVACWAVGT
jgi:hypothetical protein